MYYCVFLYFCICLPRAIFGCLLLCVSVFLSLPAKSRPACEVRPCTGCKATRCRWQCTSPPPRPRRGNLQRGGDDADDDGGQPSTGHPAGGGGGVLVVAGWFGGMPRITEPMLPKIPDIPLMS